MGNDLKQLLRSLESLDPDRRRRAVEGLAELDSLEALEALERTAREDTNLELRFQARQAASRLQERLQGGGEADEGTTIRFEGTADQKVAAIKRAAARKLPGTLEALLSHLEVEQDGQVRGTALLALGLLGDKGQIPVFSRHLADPDPNVRLNCVKALAYLDDSMAYPLFVVALNDPTPQVTSRAYGFLRKLGKGKLLALLQTMAEARHRWMRKAVAQACGRLNTPKVIPILRELAAREEGAVRTHALRSLQTLTDLGNAQARETLSALALPSPAPAAVPDTGAGSAEAAQIMATRSAGFIIPGAERDLPLNAQDPGDRLSALQDIVDEADPTRIPEVLARLQIERDLKIKSALLAALGKLGGPEELHHMQAYLEHPDARVRATAVENVGRLAGEAAPGLLSRFLEDPDNRTRANAVVALGEFPDVNVAPALVALTDSPEVNHRKSAIYAIVQLEDARFTGLLQRLADDGDAEVADRARDALKILTDKGVIPAPPKDAQAEIPTAPRPATPPAKPRRPPPPPAMRESHLPSRVDLDQAEFFPTAAAELAPTELLVACYFDYAAASLLALPLFGAIYGANPEGWRFAVMLAVAVGLPFWLVVTALSLQTGRDWARRYTLTAAMVLPIPGLAGPTRRILATDACLDFFDADPARPSGVARLATVLTGCSLVVFLVLFLS